MENIDFVYLDGLHRPYNMPLKSIVWVCRFVKYMEDHSISILPSHFYGEFFRYHLHEVVKRHEIDEDKYKGMVSISKAKIVLNWLQDKANIEELESAISKILNKRKNKEERIVYSTYKNTSYYITLAKKMRYLNSYYKLEPDAYDLLTANKRFYSLSSTEKDNIFLHIILHDADVFLPLLLSLPFKRKALNDIEDFHLIYSEKHCNVNYFNYVKKSQSANYDKVRLAWIEELNVVDSYWKIRKHYRCILETFKYKDKYFYHKENMSAFLEQYIKKTMKYLSFYSIIESEYMNLIDIGKHDLGFVNLYDLKSKFKLSFSSFEDMINSYYREYGKLKLILFSNIVSSIDARRRFIVNGNPVIKIRIINK